MTDIFHEIEEDLRRERLRKLWDRFGGVIIAACVLVVAAAAGWSGYKYWQHEEAVKASEAYESAVALSDAGKTQEAETAFAAIAKDGPTGYRTLALFRAAAAATARDRTAGIAAFDAIAADNRVPPLARDLALVRAALLLVDTAGLPEVRQRVGGIADGTGPMRHSAREALALAELKAGDLAAANKTATAITTDGESPAGIRSRAELIRRLTATAPTGEAAAGSAPTQ